MDTQRRSKSHRRRLGRAAGGAILLDNFDGSGALTAHVPDICPAGSSWAILAGAFADLAGTGLLNYTSGTNARAVINAGVTDLELTGRVKMNDTGSDQLGFLLRCAADASSYVWAYGSSAADNASFYVIGGGGGGINGSIVLNHNQYYTVRAACYGKTMRLWIDGT
jgi:hypothetical protein